MVRDALFLAACVATAGASCAAGAECDKHKWMMTLHGTFMAIGWGLLLPWGATIAMYRRYIGRAGSDSKYFKNDPSFYNMHRNLQVLGVCFVIAGFVTIYFGMEKVWGKGAEHFNTNVDKCAGMWANNFFCYNPHTKLGFAIFVMMCGQVLLGVIHHLILARYKRIGGSNWVRPVFPSYIHVYLGWALICLGLINCAFGLDMYASIFPYGGGENAREVGVPIMLAILGITVLFNFYEQVGLWFKSKHCCPFKDADNAIRCCPPSPFDSSLDDGTPLASEAQTEMSHRSA